MSLFIPIEVWKAVLLRIGDPKTYLSFMLTARFLADFGMTTEAQNIKKAQFTKTSLSAAPQVKFKVMRSLPNGQLHGKQELFSFRFQGDSNVHIEHYDSGLRHGTEEQWYDGKLYYKRTYEKGVLHGDGINSFYRCGEGFEKMILEQLTYEKGVAIGT